MKDIAAVAFIAIALSGCMTVQQPEKGIWLRADGQSGRNNPALAQQFEVDRTACRAGTDVDRACMAQRGYVLVPESQVEVRAAQLRAAAAAAKPGT